MKIMECSVKDFLLFFFFTCPADDISCWTIFSYCFVVVFYYDLIFIRFEPLTICSTFPNVFQKDFRLIFPFVVVCCCYISFSEIYFRSDDERDVVPPFKIFSSLFGSREKKEEEEEKLLLLLLSFLSLFFTAASLATNLSKWKSEWQDY